MLQKITATPQNKVTIARSNTTMKRKRNIKRTKMTKKTKMVEKKEKQVLILRDRVVKHINRWEISKRLW